MPGYPATYGATYPSDPASPGTGKAGQMPEPSSRAGVFPVAFSHKGVTQNPKSIGRS